MLRVHFPGICCSDTSPRGNWYFYNCATPIWGWFCPHDVTSWDTSLQHIPGTCTRNIFMCVQMLWFCPCYMFPLHDPNACRFSEYYTPFCRWNMSLQHVPATWPLVSAHLNAKKILGNVNVVVWRQVKRENSSLPVTVCVSKTRALKLPNIIGQESKNNRSAPEARIFVHFRLANSSKQKQEITKFVVVVLTTTWAYK